MNISTNIIKNDEKAVFALRELYDSYGYTRYKMSKFEEYDLYARNKDFLISDNVITFNDMSGKLMALKPDVTLSIVKNSDDTDGVQKVYYNENVYRVSKGTGTFKELMQVGLECIGNIDDYCIAEVLLLAANSLKSISESSVLDISHLGIISGLIDTDDISSDDRKTLVECIGQKNTHGITEICKKAGIDKARANALCKLCALYGPASETLPQLEELGDIIDKSALARLYAVANALQAQGVGDVIRIDFSVVGDINYYNGVAFKGFVEGIPTAVLTGGQYDRLMQKMGRTSGAIGFAVYLDMLEELERNDTPYDVDTIVIYDEGCDPTKLLCAISELSKTGISVKAQKKIPQKLKYRRLMKFDGNEVTKIENNA